VIIPTRNYGHFIKETLNSVLNQTYKNLEVLVVDDESSDNTKQIVTENYPAIKYAYIKHVGKRCPSNAMNYGITHSQGIYIVCLAADDTLKPNYIEKCLTPFQENPNVGFVWTGRQNFGDNTNIQLPELPTLKHHFLYPDPGGALGAMMVSREAYNFVGLYDLSLDGFEDWDFCIRAAKKGFLGIPLMEPLHNCRVHGQVQSNLHVNLEGKYPVIMLYRLSARAVHRVTHPITFLKNVKIKTEMFLRK
jgi:glycosyltransferase involved in cell wall biosynthesis